MTYEKSGAKRHKDTGKNAVVNEIKIFDSKHVLLGLVIKHKFGLVVTYAVLMTIVVLWPMFDALIAAVRG